MSENWQVGDLALCISIPDYPGDYELWKPMIGQFLSVVDISSCCDSGLLLNFAEDPDLDLDFGFEEHHFRKVTPPEADEFDREVIASLTGQPEQVPA